MNKNLQTVTSLVGEYDSVRTINIVSSNNYIVYLKDWRGYFTLEFKEDKITLRYHGKVETYNALGKLNSNRSNESYGYGQLDELKESIKEILE